MYRGADCYDEQLIVYDIDGGISGGWLKWIEDGCNNVEVKGTGFEGEEIVIKEEETIIKKPWVDSH